MDVVVIVVFGMGRSCGSTGVYGSENEDLVSILSDQARAGALDQLDPLTYSIITRENMMQILNDMGKDETCLDGACRS